jgi:hypothetical protein
MKKIDTPLRPAFAPAERKSLNKLLWARHGFVNGYCTAKEWPTDPTQLSFDQIFEIRAHEGWLHAADGLT